LQHASPKQGSIRLPRCTGTCGGCWACQADLPEGYGSDEPLEVHMHFPKESPRTFASPTFAAAEAMAPSRGRRWKRPVRAWWSSSHPITSTEGHYPFFAWFDSVFIFSGEAWVAVRSRTRRWQFPLLLPILLAGCLAELLCDCTRPVCTPSDVHADAVRLAPLASRAGTGSMSRDHHEGIRPDSGGAI
jgi:hypothetical protein